LGGAGRALDTGDAFAAGGIFAASGAFGGAALGPNSPAHAGPQTRTKAAIREMRAENMNEAELAIKER
jgi:hypothetical protein